jgi:hypothetical protein
MQDARICDREVIGSARVRACLSGIFWAAALLLGGFQFWISRMAMNTDGISYQDMADAIARGNWSSAVNAYWSPLYPGLLALGRILFRPSPYREFGVVHLINFFIFLGAARAFDFFLMSFIGYRRGIESPNTQSNKIAEPSANLPEWTVIALGYSLFLWSSLGLINLGIVSPDLTVALFVFIAAGIILRIKSGKKGGGEFVFLGLVLGLGYLTKAAMMPLSMVFFLSALMAACHRGGRLAAEENRTILKQLRGAVPRVALGMAVFFLIAAPLVLAISKSKGRLTIGDSARLNWAWYINHVPRYHWQGIPAVGVPTHPTHKLLSEPGVFEFDSPAKVTYDIWYDASYWNDGVRPRLDIKSQAGQLINNMRFYRKFFFWQQIGIVAACVVLLMIGWGKQLWMQLAEYREELLPPVAALAMYAPVYVEIRYFAPFVVILWMGLLAGVRFPDVAARRRTALCAAAAALVFILASLCFSITDATGPSSLREAVKWNGSFLQYEVADGLHNLGLKPGDKVAWIRPTAPNRQRYDWARLGRFKIIAEIPGVAEKVFWTASPDVQERVVEVLEGTGAKALIATQPPLAGSALDWRPIGSTGFYLVFLSKKDAISIGNGL